jgi:NADH dehydrogenase/NADH:ubiquinone oxidoreductase subunit G
VRQKSVREELKIDKDEAIKIFEFTFKQHQAAAEIHMLPEPQQEQKWEAVVKENVQFLKTALKPEQHKRLKQIAMQTSGLVWVTMPSVARELNLTEEQKQKVEKLHEEAHTKYAAAVDGTFSAGRNEKLAEIRSWGNGELTKLLTPEQKSKWKELVGEPFTGKLEFEEAERK